MNSVDQDLITTKEASKLTGYSQEWIRILARDGEIESQKFGVTTMISKRSLMTYFNKQQEKQKE